MECEKWELAWPEQRRARAKTKAKEEECENQEEETVETESNVPPPVIKATFSMPIVSDGVFLSLTFPLFKNSQLSRSSSYRIFCSPDCSRCADLQVC